MSEEKDHLSVGTKRETASDVVSDRDSCRCCVEEITRKTQSSSGLGRHDGNDLRDLYDRSSRDDTDPKYLRYCEFEAFRGVNVGVVDQSGVAFLREVDQSQPNASCSHPDTIE